MKKAYRSKSVLNDIFFKSNESNSNYRESNILNNH